MPRKKKTKPPRLRIYGCYIDGKLICPDCLTEEELNAVCVENTLIGRATPAIIFYCSRCEKKV